ncbi:MAG: polysaccharide deacetylase family protein [Marinisporobacter sp.]|jgi:probable sporulation protein (polysaccharide deacetylase family)|nr:polysaccharide deacetylase family protein [Marinisporobacter sp.]
MKIYIISKKALITIFLAVLILSMFFIIHRMNMENSNTAFLEEKVVDPIRSGDVNSNKMAFTCNIDWGNEEIPKMLDIFEKEDIKITFFITGRWAANNEELVKLIYNKGHEIGNHAYRHKMHSKIGERQNYEEIKKTEDVIVKIIGEKPKYFAPPAGDYNDITLKVARELGYETILWSVDTIDWKKGSTADLITKRVMKKSHKGAILLMHPRPATVEALPYMIDQIKGEKIKIGTVSDLLRE